MKCAKCNYDIPDGAAECPGCAAGRENAEAPRDHTAAGENRACCPQCGSPDISAVRKNYDPGCGCLGLLIFGWVGLLLGLLGAGEVDLVCRRCGAKWRGSNAQNRRNCGCVTLTILVILILLIKQFLRCC